MTRCRFNETVVEDLVIHAVDDDVDADFADDLSQVRVRLSGPGIRGGVISGSAVDFRIELIDSAGNAIEGSLAF